jgi:hypothetical protein
LGGFLLAWGVVAGFLANFIYLLTEDGQRPVRQSQIARLFELWLDAKEHELRKRAGR